MANALVRAAREGETTEHSAASGADGSYLLSGLAPGAYELRVDLDGFARFLRGGVAVAAGESASVDIGLLLEARHETVAVSESAVQVEASGAELGAAVTASRLASVPVNGRGFTDLLALTPGVVPFSSQQPNAVVMSGCTSSPPSGDLNAGNLSVSGQRETANAFVVNGSPAQEDFNMGAAIVPNLDSIQELHVLTGDYDAERGNFSGGQVLVTTKSGTELWHGSAFEYLRNTGLDARNYFAPERGHFGRNQAGGTLGGPLHGLRAFFFADYQGTRMSQGIDTGLIAVPTLAEQAGDFADAAATLTGKVNGAYWANLLSQKLDYGVAPGEPSITCPAAPTLRFAFFQAGRFRGRHGRRRPRRCFPTFRRPTRGPASSPPPHRTKSCAGRRICRRDALDPPDRRRCVDYARLGNNRYRNSDGVEFCLGPCP